MIERGDVVALHEPFFDLLTSGRTVVAGDTVTSFDDLIGLHRHRADGAEVFLKETTDHRYDAVFADKRFLAHARHAFLIRRPEEIAASYHALYPEMKCHEIGLEILHDLYLAVVEAGGHEPIVIDSDDLITDPPRMMNAYCDAVGLPFVPSAMTWEPGDRPEWRQTARWHRRTAASAGFEPTQSSYHRTVVNTERLAAFADHHRPFYERLLAVKLVP